ncbi:MULTISPECIES: TAXI family TRAP transporter solute-binding subunit [Dethiosulfovibrio]|uniref:TAXI family TRAP transporter solute-binding subunit n=2 Tax=Dethiosulfovibrio TaxID=47054 RepID=A0ABS9ENK5_9BACT|nr:MULTISPECIES: TAXI family TRAP transporter solute-binding subunit [Dethiosulfovibrio]MCF4113220.1 TAXI family TRAP transporter solute-binding subunit [Dethiosulfovibrio russensis]MCF4142284.1 TAXI family TRAP transporter solute-binding subunit [Dethiosulfovibrio marinus]MCF4144592.1 TAXI family TRAP transporter solute-binding subunit [Dethiosulfovibrio acidaminovorans]
MSRKAMSFALTVAMIIAFSLSAGATTFMRIGTASVGGGFYQIGNCIAQLGNEKLDDVNFSAVTGGSIKNCYNLQKGDVELGLVQSATLYDAANGSGVFKEKLGKLRFVTAIYSMPFHILYNKKAEISKIEDFKGKKIDFGPIGGGIEVNTACLLSAYGISTDDVKMERFNKTESSEALKVGRSQGHVWGTTVPNAMVTDMIRSGKVGLLTMSPEKVSEAVKKYPFYSPAIIPGGVYAGYDDDMITIASTGVLVARDDIPDEVIYSLLKTMYDNSDLLGKRLSYFRHFGLKAALNGLCLPIHPGATKFYKEEGLM